MPKPLTNISSGDSFDTALNSMAVAAAVAAVRAAARAAARGLWDLEGIKFGGECRMFGGGGKEKHVLWRDECFEK